MKKTRMLNDLNVIITIASAKKILTDSFFRNDFKVLIKNVLDPGSIIFLF